MANYAKSEAFPNASSKNMTLMAVVYDGDVNEDKKKAYVDISALQSPGANPQLPPQTNAHLVTKTFKNPESGKTGYLHKAGYFESQIEKFKDVSGENTRDVTNKDGEKVGTAYVFNGDVMGRGLVNTNSLEKAPEGLEIPENVLSAHMESVVANVSAAKEAKAAAKEAESAQAETSETLETPEADDAEKPRNNKGQFVSKAGNAPAVSKDESLEMG